MSLDLSNDDHNIMDKFLNGVLDSYKDGSCSLLQARADIAEAMTLAAKSNPTFVIYMKAKITGSRRDA